jgi:hypothetical protein
MDRTKLTIPPIVQGMRLEARMRIIAEVVLSAVVVGKVRITIAAETVGHENIMRFIAIEMIHVLKQENRSESISKQGQNEGDQVV